MKKSIIGKYLSSASAVRRALLSSSQRKHWLRLLLSFRQGYLLEAATPWIPFDAIDFIAKYVPKGAKVFEYGSGASTLFWLKHSASCVSIEHDHDWFLRMQKKLEGNPSVDLRWVGAEPGGIGSADPSEPTDYASSDADNIGKNFRRYASQIDAFPDKSFDLVVVDGRARPSCLMHGARKVRAGGILFLDNSDRAYYLQRTQNLLQGFAAKKFFGATPSLTHWSESTAFIKRPTET